MKSHSTTFLLTSVLVFSCFFFGCQLVLANTTGHHLNVIADTFPIPDIQANGSDGPIMVSLDDSIRVTVSLDPGTYQGQQADWWLVTQTPFASPHNFFSYIYPVGWQPGVNLCLQIPLVAISTPVDVLDAVLPEGGYTFYFGVDDNGDGCLDGTWLDSVEVWVTSASSDFIIDHTCTDLSKIPEFWINQAKSELQVCYGHTSHGSQPITGMEVLMNINNLFTFNPDGSIQSGILSLADTTPEGDLGHNGDTSWADKTRYYLDSFGSDRNVVIWSWCGGVSDNTKEGIDKYLSAMNELELQYPSVTFVYMTGHLDGTGETGNLHSCNNQIREYCRENHKVLYDFADIESYDPDGACYLGQGADDGCYYHLGQNNWAKEWCAANPHSELCTDCGYQGCCAHSEPLNCNLKARAFWWMLARIVGWEGDAH